MNRERSIIAGVVFSVVILLLAGVMVTSASGYQTGGNETGEYIDNNTELLGVEYDSSDQTATLRLRSQSVQQITIIDLAGYWTDGEPASRQVSLVPGETAEVTISVSKHRGSSAVGLDTEETFHPLKLKEPSNDLSFLEYLTSQQAVAVGAASAFSWFLISGVYVLYIEGGEPEVA